MSSREGSVSSHPEQQDQFLNLENRRDREIARSKSRSSKPAYPSQCGHLSNETVGLRREVNHLCRRIRWNQRNRRSRSPTTSSGSRLEPKWRWRRRNRTRLSKMETDSSKDSHRERQHYKQHRSILQGNRDSDTISKALSQISKFPFMRRIERAKLPKHFAQPTFAIYNGRTDPIEHISHLNQKMAIYTRNKALMCKVFPSSLGLVSMRWFDGLRERSIDSYEELTRAFGVRFVTCNKEPRTLDSLLALAIRVGETLKTYSNRYWELYNELDGDFEDMAVRTFKSKLPTEPDLWESLTMKPTRTMKQLMDWMDEHKSVEDDRPQIKGKAKGFHNRKDNRFIKTGGNWPKANFHN